MNIIKAIDGRHMDIVVSYHCVVMVHWCLLVGWLVGYVGAFDGSCCSLLIHLYDCCYPSVLFVSDSFSPFVIYIVKFFGFFLLRFSGFVKEIMSSAAAGESLTGGKRSLSSNIDIDSEMKIACRFLFYLVKSNYTNIGTSNGLWRYVDEAGIKGRLVNLNEDSGVIRTLGKANCFSRFSINLLLIPGFW